MSLVERILSLIYVLEQLENESTPSRSLDTEIAIVLGYEKVQDLQNETWFDPTGRKIARLPLFTSDCQSIWDLAQTLAPDAEIGLSWERELASASIGGSVVTGVRTPAIALCIALIRFRLGRLTCPE